MAGGQRGDGEQRGDTGSGGVDQPARQALRARIEARQNAPGRMVVSVAVDTAIAAQAGITVGSVGVGRNEADATETAIQEWGALVAPAVIGAVALGDRASERYDLDGYVAYPGATGFRGAAPPWASAEHERLLTALRRGLPLPVSGRLRALTLTVMVESGQMPQGEVRFDGVVAPSLWPAAGSWQPEGSVAPRQVNSQRSLGRWRFSGNAVRRLYPALRSPRVMEAPNLKTPVETPPGLSIVLPAFNEEGNIARAVRDAFAGAAKIPMTCEVVVVNDGSRDATASILGELKGEFGSSLRVVDHPVNLGYGVARGAEMLSLMLGFGIVSRLASGWISDRIGGVRTLLLGSALQGLTLSFYLPFDGLTSLYVVSALFGLAQGGIVPSYAIIVREYMPAAEAGTRVGVVLMATIVGMAIGGWMSGVIFDVTGSYQAAFVNGLAWNLVNVAIGVWLLTRGRPSRLASA